MAQPPKNTASSKLASVKGRRPSLRCEEDFLNIMTWEDYQKPTGKVRVPVAEAVRPMVAGKVTVVIFKLPLSDLTVLALAATSLPICTWPVVACTSTAPVPASRLVPISAKAGFKPKPMLPAARKVMPVPAFKLVKLKPFKLLVALMAPVVDVKVPSDPMPVMFRVIGP